jgi:hypothetical protein
MESSSKLLQYFWALVEQLPSLLTLLGCIVFAFMRWKRHPKVSLTIIVGLGLLFFHALVFLVIFDVVPRLFIKPGTVEDTESIRKTVSLVLGLLFNTGLAVAFAVLLAGVFMERKPVGSNEPQPG